MYFGFLDWSIDALAAVVWACNLFRVTSGYSCLQLAMHRCAFCMQNEWITQRGSPTQRLDLTLTCPFSLNVAFHLRMLGDSATKNDMWPRCSAGTVKVYSYDSDLSVRRVLWNPLLKKFPRVLTLLFRLDCELVELMDRFEARDLRPENARDISWFKPELTAVETWRSIPKTDNPELAVRAALRLKEVENRRS